MNLEHKSALVTGASRGLGAALARRLARAVEAAKARGSRVIAVGTTVVRALEGGALERGSLSAGRNETSLVIGPGYRPRIVDGLFTGLHAPATSHFALLEAFADQALLVQALEHAARAGYLEHEFGDSCLVLRAVTARRAPV